MISLETLSKNIEDFRGLIAKQTIEEQELQTFFEKNPEFLCLAAYKRLFPKIVMERTDGTKLIPDFFLERVIDNYCDILDIKLPQKQILTGAKERKRFTVEVYNAIAQMREYKECFENPRNRKEVKTK